MANRIQPFDARQSMENKEFEVFHYREHNPRFVSAHHHDFYEVCFLLGGKTVFQVEGQDYPLEPGDLLLVSPQELHRATGDPDILYERIVLWIDRGYLAELGGGQLDLTACFDRKSPTHTNRLHPSKLQRAELGQLLQRLTTEYYSTDMGGSLYARGLLLQFMVEINRLTQQTPASAPQPSEPDLVSRVLTYIGEHYPEPITLEKLAEEFFVSKYHLSHEFSHRVGTSVYRYVVFRRLMAARERLAAGQAPGEVYQACGFGDYANFFRAFRSEYGISPRDFAAAIKTPPHP